MKANKQIYIGYLSFIIALTLVPALLTLTYEDQTHLKRFEVIANRDIEIQVGPSTDKEFECARGYDEPTLALDKDCEGAR